MNWQAIRAIYVFEMARTFRTIAQSIISPVLSTVLYFVVFGAAIGGRIQSVEGISYGAFIVPGLIMLTLLQQAVTNASFGIYFPKFIGTIYELLSAPMSFIEIVIGYVGAAATKAIMIAVIILVTSTFFVELTILHPVWMVSFLILTAGSFALLGFFIGIKHPDAVERIRFHEIGIVQIGIGTGCNDGIDRIGHFIHRTRDPRRDLLFEAFADYEVDAGRLEVVESVLRLTDERIRAAPNVDLALGALTYLTGMGAEAGEVIFAVARTAGWIAHAIEEYDESPIRFRPVGRYVPSRVG